MVQKRFWSNVAVCEHGRECEACCFEWRGARDRDGYGRLYAYGRKPFAHRLAYELTRGRLLPLAGLCVLHRCDCPLCVNPQHLFVGTHTDNMRDKAQKGRVPNARFSPQAVRAVRKFVKAGDVTKAQLARFCGVSPQCIRDIVRGANYRHVV